MKAEFTSTEPTPRASLDNDENSVEKKANYPAESSESSAASSVIESSTNSTAIAPNGEGDEPDGGLRAWLVVFGSFLIHTFCFLPSEYIFGLFESAYLVQYPGSSHSEIAFIGTLGSAATYLVGFMAGYIADKLGYRLTALLGTAIMTVALVLASFTHAVWHLYLTQGILFGAGASLVYYPAIGAPSYWFSSKRGMAIGIAVSGTGIGGFVGAPAAQALLDSVGTRWTLRALALVCLVLCGSASFMIRERGVEQKKHETSPADNEAETGHPLEKTVSTITTPAENSTSAVLKSFLEQLQVFKDPQFLSLAVSEVAVSFGFLIPMYFYQTYAIHIGLSSDTGSLITGLASGASCLGRIILGMLADRLPRTLVVSFCAWALCLSVFVLWTVSKSFGVYLTFCLTYGFMTGGYVSLIPLVLSDNFDAKRLSTVIGFLYGITAVGMLFGATIAGAILDATKPNLSYIPVIMTAGAMLFVGASGVTAWVYFRRKAKKAARASAK
ncbi:hypothetical protein BGW42_005606 [Actinomortierella wolfii]|nr:hypothetical protein BGW42_005606 [Actinomortierella wolfii]